MPKTLLYFRFCFQQVESFPPEGEVRAVLESQFMARRLYAEAVGLELGQCMFVFCFRIFTSK